MTLLAIIAARDVRCRILSSDAIRAVMTGETAAGQRVVIGWFTRTHHKRDRRGVTVIAIMPAGERWRVIGRLRHGRNATCIVTVNAGCKTGMVRFNRRRPARGAVMAGIACQTAQIRVISWLLLADGRAISRIVMTGCAGTLHL
jgi:hypothetical protein